MAPLNGPMSESDVQLDYVGNLENAASVLSRLYRGEKRLVFCDSRSRAEGFGLCDRCDQHFRTWHRRRGSRSSGTDRRPFDGVFIFPTNGANRTQTRGQPELLIPSHIALGSDPGGRAYSIVAQRLCRTD